jgi:hypothetical protein
MRVENVSNNSYYSFVSSEKVAVMENEVRKQMPFTEFYATAYRDEHRHPVNLALHIVGVFAGLGVIAASVTISPWWTAFGFPIAHVAPGLLGHRLFDRDEDVGDLRLTRADFPLWWFLVANHLMAARVLTFRW